MTSNASRLKEALAGGQVKEKGPVVADGVLSITPDPPETSWGASVLDTLSADSIFLEDDGGKQPNQLFGKFTWRIENFSEICNHGTKRELRSNQFSVGEYKWYILVYPQGCDVCNHLSLFLCVADYDKLLPGWSHFAQFTIAVVNKDPKKSKYSDTLHRFCKKEHDWGWKKFMELSKVLDGFTVADTLVIKAQVQVILDRPSRPFRCLDSQYRRELVRVYLTNVESICRRFCEEKRQRLAWLRTDSGCFRSWWVGLSSQRQKQLTSGKGDAILKGIVKQFFNEKEVTSTLVMDALFCGCRQLDKLGRDRGCLPNGFSPPTVVMNCKTCTFSFAMDALDIVQQLDQEFLPASREDKALALCSDGLGLRSGCDDLSDLRRDALERDEKRLAELGRRTVEMFALAHIFTEQLERAYRDFECEQRMKDLIAEEEAEGRLMGERAAARAAADKEKKAKKRERMKAKKEADRSKREVDVVDHMQQTEAALVAQDENAADVQQQHDKAEQLQQQQQIRNASKQQAYAVSNGTVSHNSSGTRKQQQQRLNSSSSVEDEHGPSAAAGASSRPGSAQVGPTASSCGRLSCSSSPLLGSAAASSEALSGSDSDAGSIASSNGFTPVRRQQQQQQQARPGSSHSLGAGSWGTLHHVPSHHHHQQQQHLHQPGNSSSSSTGVAGPIAAVRSSSGSIPTGYAAAVAGMRPPPPAEATAVAVAMAEQQRRVRELEDQVIGLKQQLQGLQAAVNQRDAQLAHKEQEIVDLKAQLAQQQQQIQQLTKQAAGHQTTTAAATAASSKEASGGAGGAGSSRCNSRSWSTSVNLSASAAVAPPGTPAPWAAVAAGTASSSAPTPAAAAAASGSVEGVGSSSDLVPASPPAAAAVELSDTAEGEQPAQASSSSRVADAAAASGPTSEAARLNPMSYAATVSGGLHNQHRHMSLGQQQQTNRPPHGGRASPDSTTPPASVSASAARPSSGHSRSSSDRNRAAAGPQPQKAVEDGSKSSSSSSVMAADAAAAAEDGPSEDDAPLSPSALARSGSAAAAAAPGPPAVSSTGIVDGKGADVNSNSSSPDATAAAPAITAAGSQLSSGRAASAGSGSRDCFAAEGLPRLTLKDASAYITTGIAGVLHSSTPLSGEGPPTPSFSNSSTTHISSGSSNSSEGAAAAGPRVLGVSSGNGILSSGSNSGRSKAGALPGSARGPFDAFGSQLPAAGDRGIPFGALASAGKASAHGGQRVSQTSILEDNGLDGFVHMNMIDDLLTE